VDAASRSSIESALSDAKGALDSEDVLSAHGRLRGPDPGVAPLAEEMYKKAARRRRRRRHGSEPAGQGRRVVDADFEE